MSSFLKIKGSGESLCKMRNELNKNQLEMCKLLGWTQWKLSRVENNHRELTSDDILHFSRATGLALDFVLLKILEEQKSVLASVILTAIKERR